MHARRTLGRVARVADAFSWTRFARSLAGMQARLLRNGCPRSRRGLRDAAPPPGGAPETLSRVSAAPGSLFRQRWGRRRLASAVVGMIDYGLSAPTGAGDPSPAG